MINKRFVQLFQTVLFTSVIELTTLIKVNFIFGSKYAFFSAINMIFPLSGTFGGMGVSMGVVVIRRLLRLSVGGLSHSLLSVYHIPTLFASAYWRYTHWSIRFAVPLVCMILFISHPVGSQAFAYSLYWLIPMALYFVPRQSIFMQALGSTFVAHAVGSVIWLYTVPMAPSYWLALIPVVLVERLFFATAMTGAYHGITAISGSAATLFQKISSKLVWA